MVVGKESETSLFRRPCYKISTLMVCASWREPDTLLLIILPANPNCSGAEYADQENPLNMQSCLLYLVKRKKTINAAPRCCNHTKTSKKLRRRVSCSERRYQTVTCRMRGKQKLVWRGSSLCRQIHTARICAVRVRLTPYFCRISSIILYTTTVFERKVC